MRLHLLARMGGLSEDRQTSGRYFKADKLKTAVSGLFLFSCDRGAACRRLSSAGAAHANGRHLPCWPSEAPRLPANGTISSIAGRIVAGGDRSGGPNPRFRAPGQSAAAAVLRMAGCVVMLLAITMTASSIRLYIEGGSIRGFIEPARTNRVATRCPRIGRLRSRRRPYLPGPS